jgi:hypothetical protein
MQLQHAQHRGGPNNTRVTLQYGHHKLHLGCILVVLEPVDLKGDCTALHPTWVTCKMCALL